MADSVDRVTIAFGDGGAQLDIVTEMSLHDSFLEPCQTMTCSVAADETRFDVVGRVRPGSAFRIEVNGHPQCSGIVDSVEIEASRDGRIVSIAGRDLLSQMVDGNADPRFPVAKEMAFEEFVAKAFAHFGLNDVTFFEEYEEGRNLTVGKAIKTKKQAGKRRRQLKDPVEQLRPKDNEGGWQWFVRIAHRLGYHAWVVPGRQQVIVGTPDYDQDPAYRLVSKRSQGLQGYGGANNLLRARARLDITGLPSHVYVRGKGSKGGKAATYIGHATNPQMPVFKPFFVCDDDSSSKAHCDAYARLILSRAQRNAQTYECTLRGLSDPVTRAVYNVDTIAEIDDENCGVSGRMWVESRDFRYSRSNKETSLRLIPADALLMDFYVSDSVPPGMDYADASTTVKPLAIPSLIGVTNPLNWGNFATLGKG